MVAPSHPLLLTPWKTHALGVCDKTTQTIYVDKTLKPKLKKEISRNLKKVLDKFNKLWQTQ